MQLLLGSGGFTWAPRALTRAGATSHSDRRRWRESFQSFESLLPRNLGRKTGIRAKAKVKKMLSVQASAGASMQLTLHEEEANVAHHQKATSIATLHLRLIRS